jgi:serine protease AprX
MAAEQRQQQISRLLDVLRGFARTGTFATVAVLAAELVMSSSTVRRLLSELVAAGLVQATQGKAGRTKSYRITESTGTSPVPPVQHSIDVPIPLADTPSGGRTGETPNERTRDDGFDPGNLDRMVISLPLQQFIYEWEAAVEAGATPGDARFERIADRIRVSDGGHFSVIIDLNMSFEGGTQLARQRVLDLLLLVALRAGELQRAEGALEAVAPRALRDIGTQYVVARLRPHDIWRLVNLDQRDSRHAKAARSARAGRAIFRIWPDSVVKRQAFTSLPTIKCDAANRSFGCTGRGIVWAVVDSGIDATHPHFAAHRNLDDLPAGVAHADFVSPAQPEPLLDPLGHGTHVAGIIAGEYSAQGFLEPVALMHERSATGERKTLLVPLGEAAGVAPECKLVSFKVLDGKGKGGVTEIMAALEQILRINGFGKMILIHGVNLSLGYRYEAQWFACGHSPLCEVVNRLSKSGVCVVTAAGNSGYGEMDSLLAGTRAQGMPMSINDPGNAEHAITVGSTHRDAPHTYGVSYFSSKGPTGDGRLKPDLLAPGEKIISCMPTTKVVNAGPPAAENPARYIEDSGTSMAAPHVSGAIAALLSVRREFIGRPEDVKRVLMASALDLGRERSMQGSGLVDMFKTLQSI